MIAASVIPAQADQIADKQAEAAQLAKELNALDAKVMDLQAEEEAASYELYKVQEEVVEAQARADKTQAEVQARTEELRSFSVSAYVSGGSAPQFDALMTAEGDTVAQKQVYAKVTTGSRSDALDNLAAAKQEAERDIVDLEAKQAEAEALTEQIQAKQDQAEKAAGEQRAVTAKAQGELATLVEAKRQAVAEAAAAAAAAQRAAAARPATGGSTGTGGNTANGGNPGNAGGSDTTRSTTPPVQSAPKESAPSLPPPPVGSGASGAIAAAQSRLGAPYVWGAGGPGSFDCSGLVAWAYAQVGIRLPHYSGAQYQMTTRIGRGDLQPGDLVFWGGGGSEHVAIYMGGNSLIHAYRSGRGVGITPLDGWWKTPSGYGRL